MRQNGAPRPAVAVCRDQPRAGRTSGSTSASMTALVQCFAHRQKILEEGKHKAALGRRSLFNAREDTRKVARRARGVSRVQSTGRTSAAKLSTMARCRSVRVGGGSPGRLTAGVSSKVSGEYPSTFGFCAVMADINHGTPPLFSAASRRACAAASAANCHCTAIGGTQRPPSPIGTAKLPVLA
jgi:hypothetical protein